MSDGKITLYLELEEAEQIFDCLRQREELFNKAFFRQQDDAKTHKSIMKQLEKVTFNLGVLFANAHKALGNLTRKTLGCRRRKKNEY